MADRYKQLIVDQTPLGRMGEAEEIANLVAFLASVYALALSVIHYFLNRFYYHVTERITTGSNKHRGHLISVRAQHQKRSCYFLKGAMRE